MFITGSMPKRKHEIVRLSSEDDQYSLQQLRHERLVSCIFIITLFPTVRATKKAGLFKKQKK